MTGPSLGAPSNTWKQCDGEEHLLQDRSVETVCQVFLKHLENGSGRDEPVICSPRSALAAAGSSNTGALDVASRVLPCGKFGIMICITCNTPSWWSGQAHPITENMLAVKSLKQQFESMMNESSFLWCMCGSSWRWLNEDVS